MPLPPELLDTYRTYWQFAQEAAQAKAEDGGYAYTVTDLVAAAAQAARDTGTPFSFQTSSQLSQLFGMARVNDRAIIALTTAAPDSLIDSSMVAAWPTAAPVGIQDAQPEYMARAQFTYTNMLGGQQTGWITLTGLTQVPATTTSLLNRLQGAAMTAYSTPPEEGGSPKSDAEMMAGFGDFTEVQLYAV